MHGACNISRWNGLIRRGEIEVPNAYESFIYHDSSLGSDFHCKPIAPSAANTSGVALARFPTHPQRRTESALRRHDHSLRLMSKARHFRVAEADTQLSKRQHIAIRPATRFALTTPNLTSSEQLLEQIQFIPKIIHDAYSSKRD